MKLRGYNFFHILHDATTEDEIVLLTYLAMMRDYPVAHDVGHLKRLLHLKDTSCPFYMNYVEQKEYRLYSRYNMGGAQINFTNPRALKEDIPVSAKLSYLRLTSLISNDQRWRYIIWKEPMLLPREIITELDKNIPDEWIKHTSTNLQMIEEEAYYGN